MSKLARIAMLLLVLCVMASAQSVDQKPQQQPSASNPAATAAQNPGVRPDPAQQMKMDLDQMDSLLNNMATQTSFIHDTNMSILLNTNVRLWSLLLRDLRLQLDEQ